MKKTVTVNNRQYTIEEKTDGSIWGILSKRPKKKVFWVREYVGAKSYDRGGFDTEKQAMDYIEGKHWLKND